MYPQIEPSVKIEKTISHPIRSEEVVGFVGRNTKIGRKAVMIKRDGFASESRIAVPVDVGSLVNGDSELLVLGEDEVLGMDGSDFAHEFTFESIDGRGIEEEIRCVSISNPLFRSFPENKFEVKN